MYTSINTTHKYVTIDLEAKRVAIAKAKPVTKYHQVDPVASLANRQRPSDVVRIAMISLTSPSRKLKWPLM
ncbi:MAG: hypothetical protein QOF94_200 [Acidobacteriaceae bacterium]|jgi:hypothetical protein